MAERGYSTLAFDYRYFGESGGQPRQFENPAQTSMTSRAQPLRFRLTIG
jgi:uncharacterized protein